MTINQTLPKMPRSLRFTATSVTCDEAGDFEIVQVCFDTLDAEADEEKRTSPYLMLSANFEFDDDILIEFHDGCDYDGGGRPAEVALRRERVVVIAEDGDRFEVDLQLSQRGFNRLRRFLKVLMGRDCLDVRHRH